MSKTIDGKKALIARAEGKRLQYLTSSGRVLVDENTTLRTFDTRTFEIIERTVAVKDLEVPKKVSYCTVTHAVKLEYEDEDSARRAALLIENAIKLESY